MESEKGAGKLSLYDKLHKLALICIEFKDYAEAQKILSIMVEKWPERVIAKGKTASNVNVPNSKLDTSVTIP